MARLDIVGYSCMFYPMRVLVFFLSLWVCAAGADSALLAELQREFKQTQSLTPESAKQLRELADSGNTQAMLVLANMADMGVGVNGNAKWAFDWTLKAARNAEPLAQYFLGERYIQRLGVPTDKTAQQLDERAIFWLNKAAQQYEPRALFALGQILQTGEWRSRAIAGVQVDPAAALQMIELAAAQDHGPALLSLYRKYHKENAGRFDPDEVKAQSYLKRCAEVGDPECAYEMATLLLTGDSETRDVPRAIDFLQMSAGAGLVRADVLLQAIQQMGAR